MFQLMFISLKSEYILFTILKPPKVPVFTLCAFLIGTTSAVFGHVSTIDAAHLITTALFVVIFVAGFADDAASFTSIPLTRLTPNLRSITVNTKGKALFLLCQCNPINILVFWSSISSCMEQFFTFTLDTLKIFSVGLEELIGHRDLCFLTGG